MELVSKDLMGLGDLGCFIVTLIDKGEKEQISKIIDESWNNNLVSYILEKYQDKYNYTFFSNTYNIEALNYYFCELNSRLESRKTGVFNNQNGLLSILSAIFNETEKNIINWKI